MAIRLPRESYRSWAGGVVTALRPEDLAPDTSPRGRNATLQYVGGDRAVPAKRRGATPLLTAAEALGSITPAPTTTATVHSQHAYRRAIAGVYTPTHLAAVLESGDLYEIDPAGTSALVQAATFSGTTRVPRWTTAKNVAYALAGDVRKKVLSVGGLLTVQTLGLTRPPARAAGAFNWNATAGGSGVMTGDYEIALTFWNDDAQLESSRSDGYTVTGASSDQLTISWGTSPDTQITHVRVHLRKVGTNAEFLRVAGGTGYVAGTGVPIATGTTALNLSDATILTYTASPDTEEHNPPAADGDTGASTDPLLGGLLFGGRLLVWSATSIYYSQFDEPEQFDPEAYEPIAPDDGQELVACHAPNDDLVLVFKRNSLYAIVGNDPNSWTVQLLDPRAGCVAPNSIVTIEGRTYWWSAQGPMVWDGQGAAKQLGLALIRDTVDPSQTNPAAWPGIVVHVQEAEQKLVWWIPEAGSTINSKGLPFNYRLGVFESDSWDPFDVASAVTAEDSDGRPVVVLGGYYGRLYHWWTADVDGARLANPDLEGFTLAGTVASATSTVITCADTVSLDATQVGYALLLTDEAGEQVTRRVVAVSPSASANTATFTVAALPSGFVPTGWSLDTAFTLQGVVAAATAGTAGTRLSVTDAVFDPDLVGHTYAYLQGIDDVTQRRRIVGVGVDGVDGWIEVYPALDYDLAAAVSRTLTIAGPDFAWDTHWSDSGDAFAKKRYMHSHLAGLCGQGSTTVALDIFTSYDLSAPSRTRLYTVQGEGALWDEGRFDVDRFGGGEGRSTFRTAVGRLANTYRFRVRNWDPNRQFVLLALGMDAFGLGDRR
jgi:hypothetical protein